MLARQRCGRACAERTRTPVPVQLPMPVFKFARSGVLQYDKPLSWSLLAFRVSKMESKDRERG